MTFTDIQKNSSERYTYVKLTPRRLIDEDDVTSISGGRYTLDFDYPITKVSERKVVGGQITTDTVDLTEASSSVLSDGDWYYDEDAKLLYLDRNTEVVAHYEQYFTTKHSHLNYKDPSTTSGTKVMWDARLKGVPRVTDTVKDVYYGIITTASYPVILHNQDQGLRSRLEYNNSWSDCPVEMWLQVDDEIEKVFSGTTGPLTSRKGFIEIQVRSEVHKLDTTFTYGSNHEDAFFTNGTSPTFTAGTVSVADGLEGTAIPIIVGQTKYQITSGGKVYPISQDIGEIEGDFTSESLGSKSFKLTCIDYDTQYNGTTQNARFWIIGKTRSPLKFGRIDSITSVTRDADNGELWFRDPLFDGSGNFDKFAGSPLLKISTSGHTMRLGETIALTFDTTHGDLDTDFTILKIVNNDLYVVANRRPTYPIIGNVASITYLDFPPVFMNKGDGFIPLRPELYEQGDYVYSSILGSDGFYYHMISFNVLPDSPVSSQILSYWYQLPSNDIKDFEFRTFIETSTVPNQDELISDILSSHGLSVNSSQFTSEAVSKSSIRGKFNTILPQDLSGNSTIRKELQPLLKETASIIYPDTSGEFNYHMLSFYTGNGIVIDEKDILLNTFKQEKQTDDVYSDIILTNQLTGESRTYTDPTVSLLYGVQRQLVEDVSIDVPFGSSVGLYRSEILRGGVTITKFRVPHKYYNVSIGDEVIIRFKDVIGQQESQLSEPAFVSAGITKEDIFGIVIGTAKSEASVSLTVLTINSLYD